MSKFIGTMTLHQKSREEMIFDLERDLKFTPKWKLLKRIELKRIIKFWRNAL